jgi:hypothetical protein
MNLQAGIEGIKFELLKRLSGGVLIVRRERESRMISEIDVFS